MTPGWCKHSPYTRIDACHAKRQETGDGRTERVPQDQSQLGNLLALLAQLQQSSLASVLVQEVGDVLQGAPVLLGNVQRGVRAMSLGQGANAVVGASETIVVLLLGDGSSCGGSLGMVGMRRLRIVPGRVGLRVLVVAVDGVGIWHHLGWRVCGRCVEESVWKSRDLRIENGRNGFIGMRRKKDGWL